MDIELLIDNHKLLPELTESILADAGYLYPRAVTDVIDCGARLLKREYLIRYLQLASTPLPARALKIKYRMINLLIYGANELAGISDQERLAIKKSFMNIRLPIVDIPKLSDHTLLQLLQAPNKRHCFIQTEFKRVRT